jgi:hypothetical protein
VILTKEFLQQFDGCTEGYRYCLQNNLIPSDYDEAIKFMRENDKEEYAIWLEQQKTSEAFVRMNGSIFTMGAYQVFNPLTGQHVRAETEEEAKTVFLEIASAYRFLRANDCSGVAKRKRRYGMGRN